VQSVACLPQELELCRVSIIFTSVELPQLPIARPTTRVSGSLFDTTLFFTEPTAARLRAPDSFKRATRIGKVGVASSPER
jgi:hypothetical protein